MEWLFIAGLALTVGILWRRLQRAERLLEKFDAVQDHMFALLRDGGPIADTAAGIAPAEPNGGETEPAAAPAPAAARRASVPVVTLKERAADEASPLPAPVTDEPIASPDMADIEPHDDVGPLPRRFQFDLEDIFGRRLPIWAGGVTLAVAGVFLVRYSIDAGLLTPLVRVIMAFAFGLALLAGAESAYRWRERISDPRVAQALAGAGLATLYAGFYLAGTQYGLVGQSVAFLGLAAVTAGAIALSFRFGLPSAVLGLVGGFAAPALVGGEQANLPLLALYLGLVTAGLTLSGRRQSRPWMGITALVGGLGWGALLLLAGDPGMAEVLALGLYFVVLGTVLPVVTGARHFARPLRIAAAAVASIELALLVEQGGFSALAWALYLLLGATLAALGWRRPEMREANGVAALVALLLLAVWTGPPATGFALVGAGIAAIFALVPLALIWRGEDRASDLWQLTGTAVGLALVAYLTFGAFAADRTEPLLALATGLLALIPAAAAWRCWDRDAPRQLAVALGAAAALGFAAALMLTPAWAAPLAAGTGFAILLWLLRERPAQALDNLLRIAAGVAVVSLAGDVMLAQETRHLAGLAETSRLAIGTLRWAAVAAVLAGLAWHETSAPVRRLAEGAGVVFAYGALAQVLPRDVLAWTAALLALAAFRWLRGRLAIRVAAAAIALLWALGPLGQWAGTALTSLAGEPVFVGAIPTPRAALLYLLPFAALLTVLRLPADQRVGGAHAELHVAAGLAIIVAHILFKQLFAIETVARFVDLGMAERSLWEALLLALAWLAWRGVPRFGSHRALGIALAAAALGHFALYSGLLHNPLWDRQAVGRVPLANLVLAGYAIAVAAALSLRRWSAGRLQTGCDAAIMVLVALGTLTLLRQAFAGTVPVDAALSQSEDLLRSLAGILLALGFLYVGSRTAERSWRIGSLAVMLVAVLKVFIVDAADLEGLLRVASFMALGFSLIGIGWVYSRQLRGDSAAPS